MSSPVTARPWQVPDGIEWTGPDPWSQSRQRPNVAGELARLEAHATKVDWKIRHACVQHYAARMNEYRRLTRLGVKCRKPEHWSEMREYRQACRRLAEPARTRRVPDLDDPASPRIVVRNFGRVLSVR